MPRPQTARKIGNTSHENIKEGLKLIRNGESIRKASKRANDPFATLKRYYWKTKDSPSLEELSPSQLQPNYSVNRIFTAKQETVLENYCALLFYGLNAKASRRVAYQSANINNLKMPASWEEKEMAGKDWLISFRRRHNITLKKPEACCLARATAFNKSNVSNFFDNLENLISRSPNFAAVVLADSDDDSCWLESPEEDINVDDEMVITEEDLTNPLPHSPKEGEYVIVELTAKKERSLYIGKVLEERNSDLEYYILFLKRKPGTNKFLMPNKPDISLIREDDLKYILPKPSMVGTATRPFYDIPINFTFLKIY